MNTQTKTLSKICFVFAFLGHSDVHILIYGSVGLYLLLIDHYYKLTRPVLQCPVKSIFHPISAIIFLFLFLVISSVKSPNLWNVSEYPN